MLDQPKHVRSCYRESFVEMIAVREKVTESDDGKPQFRLSDGEMCMFFDDMADPAKQTILHQKVDWLNLLRSVWQMVIDPRFEEWQLFLDPRFCQSAPSVIRHFSGLFEAHDNVIFLLEIFSQLFTLVPSSDSPIVSRDIVDSIRCCIGKSDKRDVAAAGFFALGNFVALGKECCDFLLESDVIPILKRFLRSSTGGNHGRCGLRLAANILSYGIEDCWEAAEQLIPVLRGNLMISHKQSRSEAARCLYWIASCEGGVEKCHMNDVHMRIYDSIMNEREYHPQIFQLMNIFIDAGCYEMFVTPPFIDAVYHLMTSKKSSETSMLYLFNYLWKIMKWAGEYMRQTGLVEFLKEMVTHGCHANKTAALVSIFHFLQAGNIDDIHALANDELVGVTADIIESLEEDDLEDVLAGICALADSTDTEVARAWNNPDLIQALEHISTTNERNNQMIQVLIHRSA